MCCGDVSINVEKAEHHEEEQSINVAPTPTNTMFLLCSPVPNPVFSSSSMVLYSKEILDSLKGEGIWEWATSQKHL